MEIKKVFGFLAPVRKGMQDLHNEEIIGQEVRKEKKLFKLLSDFFERSVKECNIQIRFLPENGKQKNEVRSHILKLIEDFSVRNCLPLVQRLSSFTDKVIKDGLVFFVLLYENGNNRILIARFPAETGINIVKKSNSISFNVLDDVFLKNSRKYKAVYFDESDQFWVGYAVDKQINDSFGRVREISNYWIKDFLSAELKLNPKRGSQMLAKALRKTITECKNDEVKQELIGITPIIKNLNGKTISFKSFFAEYHLSNNTRREVLARLENKRLENISFSFDFEEFKGNFNYLVTILDTEAALIAPIDEFDNIWNKQVVAERETIKYTTEGKPIREKITNRI